MNEVLAKLIDNVINPVVTVLFVFTFLYFIWGVYRTYIRNPEGEDSRKDGSRHVLAGIIGICIMISVFVIIRFITDTLGIQTPPTLQ